MYQIFINVELQPACFLCIVASFFSLITDERTGWSLHMSQTGGSMVHVIRMADEAQSLFHVAFLPSCFCLESDLPASLCCTPGRPRGRGWHAPWPLVSEHIRCFYRVHIYKTPLSIFALFYQVFATMDLHKANTIWSGSCYEYKKNVLRVWLVGRWLWKNCCVYNMWIKAVGAVSS